MTFREYWETLKAWSAPKILRRRRWHPRISSWTIIDQSPDLYSIVQLTPSDLVRAITQCQTNHHDTWNGPVSSITAILYAVYLKPFIRHTTATHPAPIAPNPGHYVAVLPFRFCSHGIVAVPEEIQEALGDIHHTLRQHQHILKIAASAGHDVEVGQDSHSASFLDPPARRLVVFGVVRYSLISEKKFRRIGVPEFLCKIKQAFQVQGPRNTDRCKLVMALIDLQQCGLMPLVTLERSFDEYNPIIVSIQWSELEAYVNSVANTDSLLWDLLISVNDYELPEDYGYLLDLTKVQIESGMLSQHHAVDPKRLESAIRDVFAVKREELPRDENEEELYDTEAVLAVALKYALGLALNGVDPDYPRKIVGLGWGYHLLNQGKGRLIPFRRLVKSVSPAGYRVRKLSIWMWIAVGLGCMLPIAYIVIRSATAEVPFEELINTAISLVALYIALASPTLFQTVYRGERLTDVLSNLRNIDSQEEFDDREARGQDSDILEVIRLARRPPRFFGGQNMSYLRQSRPEGLLDAKRPMLFPNLELAGYSLFEDKGGNLFMLDRWTNIFEVVIGRKLKPSTQATCDSAGAKPQVPPEEDDQRSPVHSAAALFSSILRSQTGINSTVSFQGGEGENSLGGNLATTLVGGSSDSAEPHHEDGMKSHVEHVSSPGQSGTMVMQEAIASDHSKKVTPTSAELPTSQPTLKTASSGRNVGQPIIRSRKAKSSMSGHARIVSPGMRENRYVPEWTNSDGNKGTINTSGMGIYCHPVKQTVWLRVNHSRGSFKVRYVSMEGTTVEKEITRVLPYRARKRQIESHDWRQASVETWEIIPNRTLLTMPTGMNVRDGVVGF